MRRTIALGLAWLAAASAAAVVAWTGVGLAGDQLTDDRTPTLSSEEIERALAAETQSPSTPTTGTSTTPPTTQPTTPPATDAPPPAGETRTFRTSRGTAALVFSPGGVTLAWAAPNAGYQVDQGPGDRGGWRVEFEGDDGRSRIDGWWDAGPQYRIDDDGAEDHSSGSDDHGSEHHGGDDD